MENATRDVVAEMEAAKENAMATIFSAPATIDVVAQVANEAANEAATEPAPARSAEEEQAAEIAQQKDLAHKLRFVHAQRQHRAGKFYLYTDAPTEVQNAIGARVLVVQLFKHDGYLEIHGWSPDFDPVAPGAVLPHYRWMVASEPFDVTCVRESVAGSPVTEG